MSPTPIAEEKIILGSGDVYVDEFTGTIPADATIEVEDNKLGEISGGATLEYKPEFYTAENDKQTVSKTILTKEDVSLKCGVMTWCGKTLAVLSNTARVTEAAGKRTVKIGGLGQDNGKKYVIRFVHKDPEHGDVRVTVVGQNQAGFTLAFAKNKETVVDAEFKAHPIDSEGTKVIFEESIPTV